MNVTLTAADHELARSWVTPKLLETFVSYSKRWDAKTMATRGFLAELAVARALGAPMAHAGILNTDVTLRLDGVSVQAKWNNYTNGDLYARPDLGLTADINVLVLPSTVDDAVDVAGWITRAEFAERAINKSYGYNTVRAVEQPNLHSMTSLIVWWAQRQRRAA